MDDADRISNDREVCNQMTFLLPSDLEPINMLDSSDTRSKMTRRELHVSISEKLLAAYPLRIKNE